MSAIVSENPTINEQKKIRPPFQVTKKPPALPSRGPEALLCNHTGVLISFELPSQSEFFVLFLQKFSNIIDVPTEIEIGVVGPPFEITIGEILHHIARVSFSIRVVIHISTIVVEPFDYLIANLICLPSQRAFAVCHNDDPP
jgi:hypothetical protein